MRTCTNDDLGEGVDLFPEELQDGAAIIAHVDKEDGAFALHLHQGLDCVVLVDTVWQPMATWLEGAVGRLAHVREIEDGYEANR